MVVHEGFYKHSNFRFKHSISFSFANHNSTYILTLYLNNLPNSLTTIQMNSKTSKNRKEFAMSIPPIVLFMSGNQIELTCYLVH
jgi:hypothetical protein